MLSDPELLDLYETVNSLKGRAVEDQVRCVQVPKSQDGSRISGFGSFRGLLARLTGNHRAWTSEEIAIPAALAVFAPPACWTEERLGEVRCAIASVEAFIGEYEPLIARADRAAAQISKALDALSEGEGNLKQAKESLVAVGDVLVPIPSKTGTCSGLHKILEMFAPPARWTEERFGEARCAIASVEAFFGEYEPPIAHAERATAQISQALGALSEGEGNFKQAEESLVAAKNDLAPIPSKAGTCSGLDKILVLLRQGDQERAISLLKTIKIPLANRCDRAWEFAMAWLLSASGAQKQWESEGWDGPIGAWGTLIRIVSDSVEATCNYFGGSIGGPTHHIQSDSQNLSEQYSDGNREIATNSQNPQPYRRGMKVSIWAERGTRVPFFKSFLETEPPDGDVPPKEKKSRKAEWTYQLCEALTGKNGAECLCSALHRLYLKDPAEARRLAAVQAKETGIRAFQRFAASNIKEKIRTHDTWHHIAAWDGVQPLFQFLTRAVRGGFGPIRPGQVAAGMLGHLLRQELNLHEVNVAVKPCQICKDANIEKYENFNAGQKTDVFSTDLERCDQCGNAFGDAIQSVSRQMFILLGEGGGFEPREVWKCTKNKCQAIFTDADSVWIESERCCPFCKSVAGQRKMCVHYLNQEITTNSESVELSPEEKREVWVIYHLVEQKVFRDDFTRELPPSLTPREKESIPNLPQTDAEIAALWRKWSGHLESLFERVKETTQESSER